MAEKATKHEVLMAGIGGGGVQMAGELLSAAGASKYEHVVFFPSYGSFMRGGLSTCVIILSDKRIAAPLLPKSQSVVVFESSQIQPLESRVRPGGLLLIEAAGSEGKVSRQDIAVRRIPALQAALGLGSTQFANMVMLGAYVEATKAVPLELIEAEMERRLAGKDELLSVNKRAIGEGSRLMAGYIG